VESIFAEEAGWIANALISGRIEQAALLQLLLKKKVMQPEEYLRELNAMASDDYAFSVRHFVAQSEQQLRGWRWHVGGAEATERLGRGVGLGPDDRVLDIGCGVGGPTRQIAVAFGSTVVGLDIRIARIAEAILRTSALGLTSRVTFQVGAGEHLPFEDETFDAVISQATLNWIPDKTGVLRETFRVLKPQGRFGFECEGLTEKYEASDETRDEAAGLFRILAWQQLLGATGFEDIQIEEMWEESRQFYPSGPEREQIDRGERVNVRVLSRKP